MSGWSTDSADEISGTSGGGGGVGEDCISTLLGLKAGVEVTERGACIKGLIWPHLEQQIKNCFSSISFDWFIRRITEV